MNLRYVLCFKTFLAEKINSIVTAMGVNERRPSWNWRTINGWKRLAKGRRTRAGIEANAGGHADNIINDLA